MDNGRSSGMGQRIHLYYSDDLPAWPAARLIERLALCDRPIIIKNDVGMRENRYRDAQEHEAIAYGASLLLPYAPLLQMLLQGAPMRGIAHHYGVSVAAVEMRLKFTGLWGLQQR